MTITHWDYRVLRRKEDAGYKYAIHEVYYEDNGKHSWVDDPTDPLGLSLDDLRDDLEHMISATGKPIMEVQNGVIVELKQ